MVLLGEEPQVEAHFWRLEIVLMLMRDGCMVGAERTIGAEIILDAPDGTPRCVGHVESRFGPFGDSFSAGAR